MTTGGNLAEYKGIPAYGFIVQALEVRTVWA